MKKGARYYLGASLWNFRYVILFVVFSLLISSLVTFYLGFTSLYRAISLLGSTIDTTQIIVQIISSLDEFLLGVVLLIFALGIYELFIDKIDAISQSKRQSCLWLQFTSLDQLKTVLTKVLIIILMVYFFKSVVIMKFDTPLSALYLGGGILLVAVAQYVSNLKNSRD